MTPVKALYSCTMKLGTAQSYPSVSRDGFKDLPFKSRRSPAFGTRGMVASSQPLATEAGLRILQQGGNAADAAVAVAAALNVTEPCSTGIGGDAFALFYEASSKRVRCMLGNGAAPAGLTLEAIRAAGITGSELPPSSALSVTVPGAAALWEDVVLRWGTSSLKQVLQPAIELAEGGFPVAPITAHHWQQLLWQITNQGGPGVASFTTSEGKAPLAGQIMKNVDLAATFRRLAEHGAAKGFYSGPVADAIVAALASRGGVLGQQDLAGHATQVTEPISTTYRGHTIYEVPPPTAGIAALMALNLVEAQGQVPGQPGSAQQLHRLVEAMRLALADALAYNADPRAVQVPVEAMLSKERAAARAAQLQDDRYVDAAPDASLAYPGHAQRGGDTVYFCVVDGQGNGCSFINSNYWGFGSGIVPQGCGFTLQSRGHNFMLDPGHPNCVAPGKRPYHTIIPGLVTDPEGDLLMTFGVMGAFMQPQGHLQVLVNMLDLGMDPQAALDAPRFCIDGVDSNAGPACLATARLLLEEGLADEEVVEQLRSMGHKVVGPVAGHARAVFGRGQIIVREKGSGVLWAGSDPRGDGLALGW